MLIMKIFRENGEAMPAEPECTYPVHEDSSTSLTIYRGKRSLLKDVTAKVLVFD
jgi:hypothetical protein